MKAARITGIIALVLAALLCVVGVIGFVSDVNKGPLGGILADSKEVRTQMDRNSTATKSAVAAVKKGTNAKKAADTAVTEVAAAAEGVAAVDELVASGTTGEERLDKLTEIAASINADLDTANAAISAQVGEGSAVTGSLGYIKTALENIGASADQVQQIADAMTADLYNAYLSTAEEAVNAAEESIATAIDGASSVYSALGTTAEMPEKPETTTYEPITNASEVKERIDALTARAAELVTMAETANTADNDASAAVETYKADTKMTFVETLANTDNENAVTILFTAALLLVIGVVLTFFSKQFFNTWNKNKEFPVFMVLLVMFVFQTYALGFDQPTFGEWFSHWSGNILNVFRANTSVGMIALGMTLVIITGGIDLAVGSTLAGVGTIMMVLMDTSSAGIFSNMGITGVPLMVIAVIGGIIAGVLFGLFTGVVVTKGRVPPFIVTLGTMQIIRSVAQYFTQSYSPKIPDGFTAISNTVIGGQRLLPIVYWLILAVIMHIITTRTAFGRHVYAVGSNERTTKLSGINTDKVKIKVYMLMGFIVSLATIVQLSRLGGMDVASAGSGYEMDAIAAVVVGGTSMAGGKGSIIGTILGVLIIGLMNNLLILVGVDTFLTEAFKGVIVLLAVLMQRKEKAA